MSEGIPSQKGKKSKLLLPAGYHSTFHRTRIWPDNLYLAKTLSPYEQKELGTFEAARTSPSSDDPQAIHVERKRDLEERLWTIRKLFALANYEAKQPGQSEVLQGDAAGSHGNRLQSLADMLEEVARIMKKDAADIRANGQSLTREAE